MTYISQLSLHLLFAALSCKDMDRGPGGVSDSLDAVLDVWLLFCPWCDYTP